MPCRDWDYVDNSRAAQDYQKAAQDAQAAADKTARLLCELCTAIEKQGAGVQVSQELADWWEDHKRLDAQRAAAEAARLAADAEKKRLESLRQATLAKLTPDERKALGL